MIETLERLLERLKELQQVHGNDSICKYSSFQLCIEEVKKEIEILKMNDHTARDKN